MLAEKVKICTAGDGELAQQLTALVALLEDPSWIPSSRPGGSQLSVPAQFSMGTTCPYSHGCMHTHT